MERFGRRPAEQPRRSARYILGINSYSHDSAAVLLCNGELVAFFEEERLNREKHTHAFPDKAIAKCLATSGMQLSDVDVIAFGSRPDLDLLRNCRSAIGSRTELGRRLAWNITHARTRWRNQREFLSRHRFSGRVVNVEHHMAHAASAFFASGFSSAAILTVDRGGDGLSLTLGTGCGSRITRLRQLALPHSLGEVYAAVTAWLGFSPNSEEGTVMGLSSYGSDAYLEVAEQWLALERDGLFTVDLDWFRYHREIGKWVSDRFVDNLGSERTPVEELSNRHRDVAFALQRVTEEALLHVVETLQALTGQSSVAIAGGVALNSVANARLLREGPFEEIFIQPAAGDAGTALGAALYAWSSVLNNLPAWQMTDAYHGHEFSESELESSAVKSKFRVRRSPDPAREAAEMIAAAKIIGWFQGRAEVGPRALGARSILAAPGPFPMKDRVNVIKRREAFRPFAPSVLHEDAATYFSAYHLDPFMLFAVPVRASERERLAAITHVDGTARVQSVTRSSNPMYYRLLSELKSLTGVPVVLNTSFNLKGEPIVNSPSEAVADFEATAMDALFLGPFLIEKA